MLDERHQNLVRDRLSRVQGQIGGVMKMVEADRYCVEILNQTSAIVSAIRNVENIVLENHLNTCVADAMRSDGSDGQHKGVGMLAADLQNHGTHFSLWPVDRVSSSRGVDQSRRS